MLMHLGVNPHVELGFRRIGQTLGRGHEVVQAMSLMLPSIRGAAICGATTLRFGARPVPASTLRDDSVVVRMAITSSLTASILIPRFSELEPWVLNIAYPFGFAT